jgi:hypothetical protein
MREQEMRLNSHLNHVTPPNKYLLANMLRLGNGYQVQPHKHCFTSALENRNEYTTSRCYAMRERTCRPYLVSSTVTWLLFLFSIIGCKGHTQDSGDVADLVRRLVSPNPAPVIADGRKRPTYPYEYSHESQKQVINAWESLIESGTKAFPVLIENSDDKRYSCTLNPKTDRVNEWQNWDAGAICRSIIYVQVDVYQRALPYSGVHRPSYMSQWTTKDDLLRWWNQRKMKGLRDMQIEAVEWAIAQERAQVSSFEDERKRQDILKALNDVLERLKMSPNPIYVDRNGIVVDGGGEKRRQGQTRAPNATRE